MLQANRNSMKRIHCSFAFAALASAAFGLGQQADSTGMAGDQFDLRGALHQFSRANDLESFEQAINSPDNNVSNLDLNEDGEVDFVHVRTMAEGDARVVVLSVQVNKEERQDIASIQMERNADGAVALQIRGDVALYPEGTIVEPTEQAMEGGQKRGGPLAPPAQVTVWVNVWSWPSVQWCYGPLWWEWNSPWYWGYYPPWWRPWRCWGWSAWWGFPRPYWGWYHPAAFCRVERAHNIYMHRRAVSPSFGRRAAAQPSRATQDLNQPKPLRETGRTIERERMKEPAKTPARKPAVRPQKQPAPQRTSPPSRPPQKAPAPSRAPSRPPSKR